MINKFILFLFILVCSFNVNAQTGRFRCDAYSSRTFKGNDWTDWDRWIESNYLVTIGIDSKRITIYSTPSGYYDIISYNYKTDDEKGNRSYSFRCLKDDGRKCDVDLITNIDLGDYIIVKFDDRETMYRLKIIKD